MMTETTTSNAAGLNPEHHVGQTVIGKTLYQVYRFPQTETGRAAGIVARFGLIGPRGSCYYVSDYGSAYRLNSVCLGGGVSWRAQPRPLRGLERKHLTLFYAVALGRLGGQASSVAKTAAARENAKKGGWPKGRPRRVGKTMGGRSTTGDPSEGQTGTRAKDTRRRK